MPAHDRGGAQLVKDVFGVNLQEQGRGFYVSLELLAISRGVFALTPSDLLSPATTPIRYERASHDLARRIAAGDSIAANVLELAVYGDRALQTLEALLSSLRVEIPGRRKAPRWFASHLYPFIGELVHYDAVERRGQPAIEQYVFRGGGGWAYHVLRTDPEEMRRAATQDFLADLVGDSGTSLGRIASALQSHDAAAATPFVDESEGEIEAFGAVSPWPELLRRGIHAIVSRRDLPKAKRIEAVMHWTPYCLARHALHLARATAGLDREAILVDFTRDANPVRRGSQELLDEFRGQIAGALVARAQERHAEAIATQDLQAAERWSKYTVANANFTRSPRAFFSETLAAVGALNSTVGRRHFTFKAPLLEAVVSALLPGGHEEEFEAFCRRLHDELGLIVDDRTAAAAGYTVDIDAAVFAANAEAFKTRLSAIGMLTHYSDATSIVHGDQR
ncbi:hypothetical protein [Nocardioides sp. P5_E3]